MNIGNILCYCDDLELSLRLSFGSITCADVAGVTAGFAIRFPVATLGLEMSLVTLYHHQCVNRLYAELLSFFMHGIRIRSYCIYHMHGLDFFRETIFCEVSFCSGCDRRNSFEREMIIGI